ncbi:MAG: ribonuclease H [Gammaproteobacteria bacterium]|nr:ribonuclease H [Gammaproteobacteria bacterium]
MIETSTDECQLKVEHLDVNDVATIAMSLKSLAAYSMLACEHDDEPEELQGIVDEGLAAVHKIFDC